VLHQQPGEKPVQVVDPTDGDEMQRANFRARFEASSRAVVDKQLMAAVYHMEVQSSAAYSPQTR
jgi:hypothetical protein